MERKESTDRTSALEAAAASRSDRGASAKGAPKPKAEVESRAAPKSGAAPKPETKPKAKAAANAVRLLFCWAKSLARPPRGFDRPSVR